MTLSAAKKIILFGQKFNPTQLFRGGASGLILDPSFASSMFQDSAGTTPAAAPNDPVGKIASVVGSHAFIQATAGARPLRKTAGGLWWLEADGVDDNMAVASSTALFKYLHDGTGMEIIAAFQFGLTADPNDYMAIVANNNTTNNQVGITFAVDDEAGTPANNRIKPFVTNGLGVPSVINSDVDDLISVNTPVVIGWRYKTQAGDDAFVDVNGVQKIAVAETATPSAASANNNLQLFAATTLRTAGKLFYLFIINRVLTEAQRLKVYQFAAVKAGLTL